MPELERLAQTYPGPFTQEIRPFATPAAGAEFAVTVPGGQVWSVKAVRARLVTSAAVANRAPALVIDDQTNIAAILPVFSVFAAGLTTDIVWLSDGSASPTAAIGGRIVAPMPKTTIQPGWRLLSSTALIDVADQWSQVTVWLDRLDKPSGLVPMFGTEYDDSFHAALMAGQDGS